MLHIYHFGIGSELVFEQKELKLNNSNWNLMRKNLSYVFVTSINIVPV